jgi:hypothetical protein
MGILQGLPATIRAILGAWGGMLDGWAPEMGFGVRESSLSRREPAVVISHSCATKSLHAAEAALARLLPAPSPRVRRAEPRAFQETRDRDGERVRAGGGLDRSMPYDVGQQPHSRSASALFRALSPIAQPPSSSARDTGNTGLTWKQGGPEGIGRTLEARQAPSQSIIPSISTWDRRDTTERAGQAGFPAQRVPYYLITRKVASRAGASLLGLVQPMPGCQCPDLAGKAD